MTAATVAKYYGLTVGGFMYLYSVWINLHPAALEAMSVFGDMDYKAVAASVNKRLEENEIEALDSCDPICKTALYGLIKKNNQSEEYQVRLLHYIAVTFVITRPVKSVCKKVTYLVVVCYAYGRK